jgi:hypothetical protein
VNKGAGALVIGFSEIFTNFSHCCSGKLSIAKSSGLEKLLQNEGSLVT